MVESGNERVVRVSDPRVSVVVPVFNAEKWLPSAFDSFDRQQYKNIEWVLVDDGSDDASRTMIESWRPHNGVVRILHKQNGGASSARNAGMRAATGDYLIFWDCDDTQSPEMLQKLVLALQHGSDIAICALIRVERDGSTRALFTGDAETVDSETALRKWLNHKVSSGPYTKMIKRELLLANHIEFAEGEINEDIIWTAQIMIAAKRISLIGEPLYNYISREGSVTNTLDERRLIEFENARRLRSLIDEHAPHSSELCRRYCSQKVLHATYLLLCRADKHTCARIFDTVTNEYNEWRDSIVSTCRRPKDLIKRALITASFCFRSKRK